MIVVNDGDDDEKKNYNNLCQLCNDSSRCTQFSSNIADDDDEWCCSSRGTVTEHRVIGSSRLSLVLRLSSFARIVALKNTI
jgi:hypothetical protein